MVAGVSVRSLSGSTSVREPTNRTNRGRGDANSSRQTGRHVGKALESAGHGRRGAVGMGVHPRAQSGQGWRGGGRGLGERRMERWCAGVIDAAGLARGEMGEDLLDEFGRFDGRDDAQRTATHATVFDVDVEDALEPLHPAHGSPTAALRHGRRARPQAGSPASAARPDQGLGPAAPRRAGGRGHTGGAGRALVHRPARHRGRAHVPRRGAGGRGAGAGHPRRGRSTRGRSPRRGA